MKFKILLFLLFLQISLNALCQIKDTASLNFTTVDGYKMKYSMFNDKLLIVSTFSISDVNHDALQVLDSIERKYYNLVTVIAIPISDSADKDSRIKLLSLVRDSLHLSFPVMQSGTLNNQRIQNALLRLAMASDKSPFNIKSDEVNQTWVINRSGKVYAYLRENQHLTYELIENLINQPQKGE